MNGGRSAFASGQGLDAAAAARLRRSVALTYVAIAAVIVAQAFTGRLASPWAASPMVAGWGAWVWSRRMRPEPVLRLVTGVLLVAAIVAALSLLVGLPGVLGDPANFYALKESITTPVGDHNELAGWLLVGIALVAGLRTRRAFGLTVLAAGLGATLSRGALLAGMVALAVGWASGVDRQALWRMFRALLLAGVIVLGAVALLDTTAPADGPSSSATARVELWGVAVDDIADQPLLGVGLGGFDDTATAVTGPHHHAHNGTLHALAELGLVAGALAALRLPVATWVLLRRGTTRTARVAGLAGLALLAHDQVEALALRPIHEIVVGALLALSVRQVANRPAVPS